jgi:hypothetical protein
MMDMGLTLLAEPVPAGWNLPDGDFNYPGSTAGWSGFGAPLRIFPRPMRGKNGASAVIGKFSRPMVWYLPMLRLIPENLWNILCTSEFHCLIRILSVIYDGGRQFDNRCWRIAMMPFTRSAKSGTFLWSG